MVNRKYNDFHKEEDGILYKKCIDCEEWFEANLDNFGKNKNTKSGLNARCKKCHHKHNHENYILNKEKYQENIVQKISNNELYNNEFNDYIIQDEITKIIMPTKNGNEMYAIIDTEDLERVKSFRLRWCVTYAKNTKTYYAKATRWELVDDKPKLSVYYLHILIANAQKGEYVDHRNHNTLDDRKENLRITTNSNNTKNRKSKNSNNTSGYRNVLKDKQSGLWMVRLQIDKKSKTLGKFADRHEAGKFAEEMRQKYYGEFAGKS